MTAAADSPRPVPDVLTTLTDADYAALLFAALCELQDALSSSRRELAAVNAELRALRRANVWAGAA